MTSPLEVALSYLDALGHDDPDAVTAHVADDFHNEHQSAIGTGCTGRDAYRAGLPGFMASFPNRRYTVVETIGPAATAIDGDEDAVVIANNRPCALRTRRPSGAQGAARRRERVNA